MRFYDDDFDDLFDEDGGMLGEDSSYDESEYDEYESSSDDDDSYDEGDDDFDLGDIDDDFDEGDDECGGSKCEGDDGLDSFIASELDDDFDDEDEMDDDIDADLEDLADEVGVNGSLDADDIADPDQHIPTSVDDPTPAKPVSDAKDAEGDKMMAICATPTVLEDALTIEEAAEFLESGESDIAIAEGFMLESDLSDMIAELSSDDVFTEGAKFASPNQKYKMTKKAKLKQLYELSLQIEARLHHDPYYPKIMKAYKIERMIKEGWRKRYGSLAAKRAKRYLKNLMRSKSPTLRTAAKRISKK